MRTMLGVLAVAVTPLAAVAVVRVSHGAADGPLWVVAALAQLGIGVGLLRRIHRETRRTVAALAEAAHVVGRGDVPDPEELPGGHLEPAARAIHAAGLARQSTERELLEREARMTAIVESAAEAIIVVNARARIMVVNAAAARLLGRPAAALTGAAMDMILCRRLARMVLATIEARDPRLPPSASDQPLTVRNAEGTEVAVDVSVAATDAGGERLCVLVARDITERVREEAERARHLTAAQTARAEAETTARRAALLAEASHMLSASLDCDTVLGALARLAAGSVADWCAIDLVDDEGEVRRVAVAHGDPARADAARALQERYPAAVDDPDTVWRVLTTGDPILVPEVTPAEVERRARGVDHLRVLRTLGVRSVMVVPFVARGRTLGAMSLVRAAGEAYDASDLVAARELAERAALALDNGELYRRAQDAHARFAALVEELDAIVWEADAATGDFTFVSHRAETLLGYPLTRWTQERDFLAGILHPDDQAAVRPRLAQAARPAGELRLEFRVLAADGRVLWLNTIVRAVRVEGSGASRLHGLMIDVTERRRVEEERARLLSAEQTARAEAESAARRARFLAEAGEALASSLDYEATLESLTRLAVPEVADWCLVHLAGDPRPRLIAACADPAHAGLAASLETLVPALDVAAVGPVLGLLKDGEPVLVSDFVPGWLDALRIVQQLAPRSVISVPLTARGRTLGSLVFVSTRADRRYGPADLTLARDLAHRAAVAVDNARLFQEAERANRAKDEFVATLSHELRTPLTAMFGWVHMLRAGRLGAEDAEKALESIERNTRLQTRLITDLLDISRIAAGKLPLERRAVDLAAVVTQALETVRREARGKALDVECSLEPGPHRVLGDATRLEQVVLNLLGNAVKFTPQGGRVDVRLERDAGFARLRVRDTGEGIDPAVLPQIFGTFQQADSTSTRRHGGLGLGLAIVRHLVDLHGGRVTAESAGKGCGATFTVWLPLLLEEPRPADAPPEAIVTAMSLAAGVRLDGVRALVVDDDPDARRLVSTILADRGADAIAASSVEEALGRIESTFVDVVISDIGMPEADGYELMRRLRERERAHGGHIPAVALTAYAGDEARERALAAGFSHYVTKPVAPAVLAEVVAEAAGRRTSNGPTRAG